MQKRSQLEFAPFTHAARSAENLSCGQLWLLAGEWTSSGQRKKKRAKLSPNPLFRLVGRVRFERTTNRLKVCCSTD